MTRDPAVLMALADRLEKGERGREIEREVFLATGYLKLDRCVWYRADGSPINPAHLPCLTTSLDAISAFTEAVLPGWHVAFICQGAPYWMCDIACVASGHIVRVNAPTEPAARLSAAFRALASEASRG